MLSLLLPAVIDVELLRACLWTGDAARSAWRRWCAVVGDPRRALARDELGAKPLLGLLYHSLRCNGLEMDSTVRASLAAVAMAEARRDAIYNEVLETVAQSLGARALRFRVLKGAALAATVYPLPTLRHSHDIDLLVAPGDVDGAAAALAAAGLVSADAAPGLASRRFAHASGLPVEIHATFCRFPFYRPPLVRIGGGGGIVEAAGVRLPTLAPAHQLLHVCAQASCGGKGQSLLWVCDAWYLIEGATDLDWDELLELGERCRLALPLATLLDFLAAELAAAVPARVRESLAAMARSGDRVAYEVALFGVRAGRRGRLREMLGACDGWASRRDLARWMLLPSAVSLAQSEPSYRSLGWPWYYVVRPLAYLGRRVGWSWLATR